MLHELETNSQNASENFKLKFINWVFWSFLEAPHLKAIRLWSESPSEEAHGRIRKTVRLR